ncbi:MAG: pilus assembly protein CpaE [Anaerolineae bacterium]
MISLETARELKGAGLTWKPKERDAFVIPDRDLDDNIFVITNMAIQVRKLKGFPAVMFQGAFEWALDYIWLSEVVWLPRESQLREQIANRLGAYSTPSLRLTSTQGAYVCEIAHRQRYHTFAGADASAAYAQALLYLLKHP